MAIWKIVRNEFRLIRRDSILFLLAIFVVYMGVVLRFLLPWLNDYLMAQGFMPGPVIGESFSEYYPLVMFYMVLLTGPQLSGTIFGMLVLSDKDDQTIKALMVSPVSSDSYINRRIGLSTGVGLVFVLSLFYMINVDMLSFWKLLVLAIGSGTSAPLFMLFLSIIASSKVQGLNYAKSFSLVGMLLIISWFVQGDLQLLFGIVPPFWIFKAYILAVEAHSQWLLYLMIGIIYQGGLTYLLAKVFQKRIYRIV